MNGEKLKDLAARFPDNEIEWRVQHADVNGNKPYAVVVPYITARAVQDRLDAVCGPENWRNEYRTETVLIDSAHFMDQYEIQKAGIKNDGSAILKPEQKTTAVFCGISIRMDSGEWVTKWDASEMTDIEAVKGGASVSERRAGVQWGIGRYLYSIPQELLFVQLFREKQPGAEKARIGRENWYFMAPVIPVAGVAHKPVDPVNPENSTPKSALISERIAAAKKNKNIISDLTALALVNYAEKRPESEAGNLIGMLGSWAVMPDSVRTGIEGQRYLAKCFTVFDPVAKKISKNGQTGYDAIMTAIESDETDVKKLLENLRQQLV